MLHITSGDVAGDTLLKYGIPGEVWFGATSFTMGPGLRDGQDDGTLDVRARFLERATGGELTRDRVLETLKGQYQKLPVKADDEHIVL